MVAIGGTGPAEASALCQRSTFASLGTGGHGLPAARCTFLNFSAGASSFLMKGM